MLNSIIAVGIMSDKLQDWEGQ